MKNKKFISIILSLIIISSITTGIIIYIVVFLPPSNIIDNRKAIIISSANDFYGYETEEGFDGSIDSDFNGDSGNWAFDGVGMGDINTTDLGVDPGNPGYIYFKPIGGIINANFTYNWTNFYTLEKSTFYNITAWVYLNITTPMNGLGARVGLNWYNSTNETVRTDWSKTINSTLKSWMPINITGISTDQVGTEITGLNLVLSVQGITIPDEESIRFDDIKVEKWISVNATNPLNPFPPIPAHLKDSDGFPAQALQVYWILKSNGYSDENIFLMLYYENDANGIDIYLNDGIADNLIGAVIDVANSSVTAARVKQELNSSFAGSFASKLKPNDQLIVFMTDHGANQVLPDGNATFHFEADNSYINETEFYELMKNINVQRMMINIDCCFSGNFLNQNATIGNSWYDLSNSLLISSSSNSLSWYWRHNMNGDGFAGSWFFHVFWERLNQGDTINNAFTNALGFIPFGQVLDLNTIQKPLIHDNLGLINTWSFNGNPKL